MYIKKPAAEIRFFTKIMWIISLKHPKSKKQKQPKKDGQKCQTHCLALPHWLKSKEAVCQATQSHHHVVSLDVIVMRLMLKCMTTSKMQIQAHHLVWSVSFLVLVMFTFCGHLVTYSDMVAERVRTKVQKIRKIIRSMTKTTIISSSREKEVQMESQSQRRSGRQYVCSWS